MSKTLLILALSLIMTNNAEAAYLVAKPVGAVKKPGIIERAYDRVTVTATNHPKIYSTLKWTGRRAMDLVQIAGSVGSSVRWK